MISGGSARLNLTFRKLVGVLDPLIIRFTEMRPKSGSFSFRHSRIVSSLLLNNCGADISPQQVTFWWSSEKFASTSAGLVSGEDSV